MFVLKIPDIGDVTVMINFQILAYRNVHNPSISNKYSSNLITYNENDCLLRDHFFAINQYESQS